MVDDCWENRESTNTMLIWERFDDVGMNIQARHQGFNPPDRQHDDGNLTRRGPLLPLAGAHEAWHNGAERPKV